MAYGEENGWNQIKCHRYSMLSMGKWEDAGSRQIRDEIQWDSLLTLKCNSFFQQIESL